VRWCQIAALQQNFFLQGNTMTNFNADQFVSAQKANLEAAAGLSQTAFAGFERLVELNMAAGKAAVGESFSNVQGLLSAKTPQDLLAAQAALVQPAFEKSVSYGRHLYDIASSTGAEFTKAVEEKVAESQAAVKNLVETNLKNAPAGSDAAVAAIKTAFEAGQTAAETLKKVAKQAADTAESNFKAASAQAETAVKSTIAKAKAKA
jgi:phasin family protein